MHVVKIGHLYLATDNTLSESQRDAQRFETLIDARHARDAFQATVRPIRLKTRT